MHSRRVVAASALVLLVAGVAALILTDGDDDGSAAETATAPPAAEVEPAVADEPSGDPSGSDAESAADETAADTLRYDPALVPELPDRGEHPPLIGIDGWLQSDIESLDELRGKVVAVQFWTFGCFNCKNTASLVAWRCSLTLTAPSLRSSLGVAR